MCREVFGNKLEETHVGWVPVLAAKSILAGVHQRLNPDFRHFVRRSPWLCAGSDIFENGAMIFGLRGFPLRVGDTSGQGVRLRFGSLASVTRIQDSTVSSHGEERSGRQDTNRYKDREWSAEADS